MIGPPGVGKTSYVRRLVAECGFRTCDVYSTRPARHDDAPNVHCVTPSVFDALHVAGALLEVDQYNHHWYGTSQASLDELLDRPEVYGVVMDLTPAGACQVVSLLPEAMVIALVPIELEWLERRMRQRGTDGVGVVAERVANLHVYMCDLRQTPCTTVTCLECPTTWQKTFEQIITIVQQE